MYSLPLSLDACVEVEKMGYVSTGYVLPGAETKGKHIILDPSTKEYHITNDAGLVLLDTKPKQISLLDLSFYERKH